ncbi:hypothetical protein BIV57_06740 [Mangrovactinospora gilvigrisea]|uniref:Uncharacterized protein n=1 Tax=Mangrovactinospora gilvigrisea TaxID=1428644 RepID=A0A1J7CEV9_9ACTN|nr:hypothetical protein BIV57_06740 [Mangrovactinospora gilvigrisea]
MAVGFLLLLLAAVAVPASRMRERRWDPRTERRWTPARGLLSPRCTLTSAALALTQGQAFSMAA